MKQIKKNTLCYYCLGCNKLELIEFNEVMRCKNFTAGVENWQELLRKELQNEKSKNRII